MKYRRGRRLDAAKLTPQGWRSAASLGLVERLNEKWLALVKPELAEQARKRAARTPVLLADLRFRDDEWWDRAARIAGPQAELAGAVLTPSQHQMVSLIREILMEAHLVVRSNVLASAFVFDMSPRVAAVIQSLSPAEIDWIAAHHAGECKPRWKDRAVFWRSLVSAAIGTDDEALSQVHRYSIQLLGCDPA